MKKTALILLALIIASCSDDNDNTAKIDYKQEMRQFVIAISEYAKSVNPSFAVIPQNGIELVTDNGESDGKPCDDYLNAIDGNGQEDLLYGYDNDNTATSASQTNYLKEFLDFSKNQGNIILVTDYCSQQDYIDDSYVRNNSSGYFSFAADHRDLDNIPSYPPNPFNINSKNITKLKEIKNFLYLLNTEDWYSKESFINAIIQTNYDMLIMDLFFHDGTQFSANEINILKNKSNGGKRLIICYMSIGEAENYRYYWKSEWNNKKPAWMDKENPDWKGNYKVKYWHKEWQDIIFGNSDSYLYKILGAGFDGVYLDIIDAFEFYEMN